MTSFFKLKKLIFLSAALLFAFNSANAEEPNPIGDWWIIYGNGVPQKNIMYVADATSVGEGGYIGGNVLWNDNAGADGQFAGGGEQLHEPKAYDHGHEDTQSSDTGQRADPREHMFAAETHKAGHVHEPIILGPVAAGEFLTRRDAPEAKVLETLGGEAVVNKVVVDVAQPIETETQCGPAGPEQHKRRQREKRREGAGREWMPFRDAKKRAAMSAWTSAQPYCAI